MAENFGKKFEGVIRKSFEKVDGVSIDRLHDQTNGFRGSQNICDFIVYKEPYEYYIECKSVHGNTLPFSNITDNQWNELLKKSQIKGVFAGIICWWIDKDVTKFIPIISLQYLKKQGAKSVRFDADPFSDSLLKFINIIGKKKKVFFDYNMKEFFNEIQYIR